MVQCIILLTLDDFMWIFSNKANLGSRENILETTDGHATVEMTVGQFYTEGVCGIVSFTCSSENFWSQPNGCALGSCFLLSVGHRT